MGVLKRWTVLLMIAGVVAGTGCPGKEGTLIKNYVKHMGKAPKISVYMNDTKTKKTMDIEEYLVGVVAGEMKPDWPLNAYAAQAILARTFTVEFLTRGGTKKLHGTDMSTDEKEAQAYNAANIKPVIREAVAKTKGQVMVYKNRYIRGWYHASSGGLTTTAKDGLAFKGPEPPYISTVKSPEEQYTPKEEFYWEATFTSDEINNALQKMNLKPVGQVQKMEIVERSKTHRAVLLKFTGDQGTAKATGADFRINVGPEKMRSIWISDEIGNAPGRITMKGRGFGHGVGLSQWGAYALAKKNWSPQRIVKHYYPKVRIEKIW